MADETSTSAVVTTPESAPATTETTPNAAATTTEAPTATSLETPEPSLLDDVRSAREELESGDKPKPEAKAEKPEGESEEGKPGDEKEPEGLTDAEKNKAAWLKNQRDKNLQEAAKLAEDRKALDEEKAAIEKAKAEITAKPKTDDAKPETTVDQSVATALENFKPIALASYEEGDNENEIALKDGIESLAKDVQKVQTALVAEIDRLKADNKRLMDLAAPYIPDESGLSPVEVQAAGEKLRSSAIAATEELMSEFGPDSKLQLDPVNLMAAWNEYGAGFLKIGEMTKENFLDKDSILRCWRHANKAKIDEIKAASGQPKPEKQVPPPVRKSEGGNAAPTDYENMTEREKVLFDLKQEEALLAGRR